MTKDDPNRTMDDGSRRLGRIWMALAALFVVATSAPAPARTIYTFDLTTAAHRSIADIGSRRRIWDEMQLVAAIQGLANRRNPRLYVYLVGDGGRIDKYWMARLQEPGEWLHGDRLTPLADPAQLITRFRRFIRGVVVWDEHVPSTSNVASTIAGVERAIPIRYDPSPDSLYSRLVLSAAGPRLPVLQRLLHADGTPLFTGRGVIPGTTIPSSGSAKCDAYLWAVEKYLKTGKCDPTRLAYYPDAYWLQETHGVPPERTLLSNHDYYIAHRGFFFDLSPWDDEAPNDDPTQAPGTDAKTLRTILHAAYNAAKGKIIQVGGFTPWDQKYTDHTGGKHAGVPTEWRYAEILSCFNAYMDADAPGLNAMANASLYQHYPLKARYPLHRPTDSDLRAKGFLDANGRVAPRVYVTIYVGDYDSAAWLYQRMPDLWNDPARGTIPLGWAFDPTLEDRFPVGLAYARKTATPNDTFVTGDSGAGYLNPGYLVPPRRWSDLPSGLPAWEAHSRRYYRRWDLGITGFVIDGNAPAMSEAVKEAYARFSPNGVVAQKVPPESLVKGVPFLRMGPDLPHNSEAGAQVIAANAPHAGPGFAIYRTILWSPSEHRALFEALHKLRPDIAIVDPYTLFLLLKHRLQETADGGRRTEDGGRRTEDGHKG